MTEYVAGFMFDSDRVALIRKNRPEWQKGKLNGIGGHIESGETPGFAMSREFEEETGYKTSLPEWWPFAVLSGEGFKVHFFYTCGEVDKLRTTTDEEIVILPASEVTVLNAIPNLTWLLPMARSIMQDAASTFHITEEY
jgi:8-oxo-dGTP diphosphatase